MKANENKKTSDELGTPTAPGITTTSNNNAPEAEDKSVGNSSASIKPIESAPGNAAAGPSPTAKMQPDAVIISVADVSKALEEQGILPLPDIVQNVGNRLRQHLNEELVWKAYKDWRKPLNNPVVK